MAAKGPTLLSRQPSVRLVKSLYVRIGEVIRTVGKGICTRSQDLEERVQMFSFIVILGGAFIHLHHPIALLPLALVGLHGMNIDGCTMQQHLR